MSSPRGSLAGGLAFLNIEGDVEFQHKAGNHLLSVQPDGLGSILFPWDSDLGAILNIDPMIITYYDAHLLSLLIWK